MSRIHEAIKRAEAEVAANHGAGNTVATESSVMSRQVETLEISSPSPETSPTIAKQKAAQSAIAGPLTFEEVRANCAIHQWKPDANVLVFANSTASLPGTEQFRTLRSRLYRICETQPLQTLLISSAIPAEGKTLVASNLAFAMARQQGCRVLLIDADMRVPRIHRLLGAPEAPGLADYLQGGASEFEIIQRGPEGSLCFVPAGNHATHPSELISSPRMKKFIERVKTAFDWIIFDSSPTLFAADASVLGGLCDGVLLVVKAGSTPSEPARKACAELNGTNLLGVVLNGTSKDVTYAGYENYSVPSILNGKSS